jgi:glycosyltransferase involved in cell wall biosynthesis
MSETRGLPPRRATSATAVRTPQGEGTGTLRVCHLIHSLREGGAEHVLVTLAEIAPDVGLELHVVSLMPVDGLRFAEELRRSGATVHSLGLGTRWDPRGLRHAERLVASLRPALLHSHLKHADLVGAHVSRRLGLPLVSTLHVIEAAEGGMGRAKRWLAAQARLRQAARTIAVSDAQRRWYLDVFPADPDRVVTIPNGVPPPVVGGADFRALHGIPAHVPLAAMVALLRPGKGHEDLFAAIHRLPADLELQVLLAGDGPRRAELEATVAADAILRRRVRLLGYVEDVAGLLAACDLVVHPSHADALPTALLYALASGVPAVATSVGGIPEIIGRDAGILVPPGDPAALAAALQTLIADPVRRAGCRRAAMHRFRTRFDARVWSEQLRALYLVVLEEQTGRR